MKLSSVAILTLLLAFPMVSFSQRFVSGYILKGDEKTSGFVSFNPGKAKDKILFKASENDRTEEIKSDGVTGFYLDEYKIKFISAIDTTTKQSVFAQVLVDGPASLASTGKSYFLSKKEERLQIEFVTGKDKITAARTRGMVTYFLSDCPEPKIAKKLTSITPSLLKSAFIEYNRCKTSPDVIARPRVEFGLLAGVNFPTLLFESKVFDYFNGQPGFKAGLLMEIRPVKFESKFMFNFQAVIVQNNFKEKSDSPLIPLKIDLNHTSLRLPVSLKFFFRPGQRGLFFTPGLSPYLVLSSNTNTSLIKFDQQGLGGFLGIGYEGKVFSGTRMIGTLRYERTFGRVTSGNAANPPGATLTSLQFDVGIKF